MQLSLVVIRTPNMLQLVSFYEKLGLQFDYHKHEQGIYHYSTAINETVFEIYPLLKNQKEVDISTRLGFKMADFEEKIALLSDNIISQPIETDYGLCAIFKDPDGRKIEVYKL